jgi:hypothetical protein
VEPCQPWIGPGVGSDITSRTGRSELIPLHDVDLLDPQRWEPRDLLPLDRHAGIESSAEAAFQ